MKRILTPLAIFAIIVKTTYATSFFSVHHSSNFSKNLLLHSVSTDLKNLLNPSSEEWDRLKDQSEILYDFARKIKNMKKRGGYRSFVHYIHQHKIKNISTSQKMMFYYYLSVLNKNQRDNISDHLKGILRFMQGDDITSILNMLTPQKYTQKIDQILKIYDIMTVEDHLSNRTKEDLLKITAPFIKVGMSEFEKNHILSVFSCLNIYQRKQLASTLEQLGLHENNSGISSIIEGIGFLSGIEKELLVRLSQKVLKEITNPYFRALYLKNLLSIDISLWRYYIFRLNAEITKFKEDDLVHGILYTSIPDSIRT